MSIIFDEVIAETIDFVEAAILSCSIVSVEILAREFVAVELILWAIAVGVEVVR